MPRCAIACAANSIVLLRTLGITTIYVTHDQSEAMALGDRIVVMQKGAMAQIGTPREIYFTPTNRFVAEFIGAANIVEAPVENGHLVLPGGRQPIGGNATLPAAVAMIRPETIRIVEAGSAPLSGTVDSVSFIGDRQRMSSVAPPARSSTVDAPNRVKAGVGDRIGLLDRTGCRPSAAIWRAEQQVDVAQANPYRADFGSAYQATGLAGLWSG